MIQSIVFLYTSFKHSEIENLKLIPFTVEYKYEVSRSSHCGAMGSVASHAVPGSSSIPGLAQWVKRSIIATAAVGCSCSWDLIPGLETPYAVGSQKRKKK